MVNMATRAQYGSAELDLGYYRQSWVEATPAKYVGQKPYASVVDAQGRYAIRNVPPGTYRVAVWNAHLEGEEREVTIRAGAQVDQALKVQR